MASGLTTLKVLFVLTSQASMAPSSEPTGVWLEELTTPYYVLQDEGVSVDLVSISGGEVPIDPRSIRNEQQNPNSVNRFLADTHARNQIAQTQSIKDLDYSQYDAIYLPGGHGTMWDLPENETLAQIIANAWQNKKIIAAVCHGVAGLVSVNINGKPLVQGKHLTGFSNVEEQGAEHLMPFLLETRLKQLGANYSAGNKFQPYAIQDGRLITGQNPASSQKVAELLLQSLRK